MKGFEIVKQVWTIEGGEVARISSEIDESLVEKAVEILLQTKRSGKRIFAAGVGTSGAAAKKIAHTLCCVEFPCSFLSPGDAVHGALGVVQPEDVVILISKGGNTREIVNMLDGLKAKNAKILAITENKDSILGSSATLHIPLRVQREPDAFNMLATASTMKVIAFFDAIAIALMYESGYTREQFAVIHPGGAVGDRLLHRT